MFGCKCLYWNNLRDFPPLKEPETFSLPSSLPQWPLGQGFASRRINLGNIDVAEITSFKFIWRYNSPKDNKKSVSFYKPEKLPEGFHCLGHYCHFDSNLLRGYLLAAKQVNSSDSKGPPALVQPLDYTLVWSSNDLSDEHGINCGYFWLPHPPQGYKPIGFVVTTSPSRPDLDEIRCVRADLTDQCEAYKIIVTATSESLGVPLFIWKTRPFDRGMWGKGVSAGTFFCGTRLMIEPGQDQLVNISCLRNIDPSLHAMPNIEQVHGLIQHYGPRVYFHPNEVYLPSSVSWFFKNGAVLCRSDTDGYEPVDEDGSNLPHGGNNDKQFWIDLPHDDERKSQVLKRGDIESAKLYVHVKPALGGTFTDLVFWIFCPFNGPATLKLGLMNLSLARTGQHVCDWEHFTLRISNFSGELYSIYFSQHSGGEWIEAQDLEFVQGSNRAVVYSSKHGHASFYRSGMYLQGSDMLGIGIRNDTARSDLFVDSNLKYEIVAAECLGDGDGGVVEPPWLGYMREWGPKIVYGSRTEIDKLNERLPWRLRCWVGAVLRKVPVELSGEEGPTGPKEKNNWFGDERW